MENDITNRVLVKNYQFFILEFTQRRQHQRESLAQFFKALTDLARNAYPRIPKDD